MRKTKNTLKKFQGVFCFICLYICLLALPEILKYNFACRRVKIQTACKSLMEGDLFMLFQTLKSIGELYKEPMDMVQRRLDSLSKPLGSLGRLEDIIKKLAGITGEVFPCVDKKAVIHFDTYVIVLGNCCRFIPCSFLVRPVLERYYKGGSVDGYDSWVLMLRGRFNDFWFKECTECGSGSHAHISYSGTCGKPLYGKASKCAY